ncbi:NDP-hexose 2,3-dehydratase family protein [Actinokineospora sp. NBRC 105648]|uniref:NDP-hexose 2,3-dehydratase family protein n=1 Tax=Actinokineospora sp. NBRC 105648 TaxID=3032206 RepID=UPI0024A08A15|nr:NDP-hexose 2,3-dehydratase family protein [Actinokineospora sp. NBRC 105648]GLZ36614.1 NDP-hexose 2,3-dehydratase [Actinokineospora sp. NBRC 105648]
MTASSMILRNPGAAPVDPADLARRFTASALATDSPVTPNARFDDWFAGHRVANRFEVTRIPFGDLVGWRFREEDGNLVHDSGGFFAVTGLEVRTDRPGTGVWAQPILDQPEIGVLGILVKEFDGVLHCLMQAKMEPGNPDTVQLSPTVQATRSNYTGLHGGKRTVFLDHFMDPARRVLVDSLQSEQGAWFLGKRNRNVVVEVFEDVPEHENFRWLTIGQVHRLLARDNVVNMDTRSVLSCVPFDAPDGQGRHPVGGNYHSALLRSLSGAARGLHDTKQLLGWLTEAKARHSFRRRQLPLAEVPGWHRTETEIAHEEGKHFTVVAADVRAETREVTRWTQPLLAPVERGVAAFLVRPIEGVLHLLVQAKSEAGLLDVCELAPTVQCMPANYQGSRPPRYLDVVLGAAEESLRFDAVQAEEGGRFDHADNRYLVVEVGDEVPVADDPDFAWMTLRQLMELAQHTRYLNVQARSLLAGLHATW